MAIFSVSLKRRWFGEELETKLAEFDHEPSPAELLALAKANQLGGGALLYVKPSKGAGRTTEHRVRELAVDDS